MKDFAELLKGLAAIFWPVAFLGVVYLFREKLAAVLDSARSRKFTLRVAGQELSMEEASQQQAALIADLQAQIVALKRVGSAAAKSDPGVAGAESPAPTGAILWVDDNPRNNSYLTQLLEKHGIQVDLAFTTDEGLERVAQTRYSAVISDMGRREGLVYNHDAGIDLLEALNERKATIPVLFFCSGNAVQKFRERALHLGARGITASASELMTHLDQLGFRLGS